MKKSNQEWLCQLTGHARRVGHIEWHPTVSNLLVSAGFDFKVLTGDLIGVWLLLNYF